jgi:hypothetical protein
MKRLLWELAITAVVLTAVVVTLIAVLTKGIQQ